MSNAISRAADSRLRRLTAKVGYSLRKSRAMVGIDNHGLYQIIDPDRNTIVAGEKFDLREQEVEEWLNARESGRLASAL